MNFTLQDILGATLAFCLFPLVIVFPGYIAGWALELFDFRHRQSIARLGIDIKIVVRGKNMYLVSKEMSLHSSIRW